MLFGYAPRHQSCTMRTAVVRRDRSRRGEKSRDRATTTLHHVNERKNHHESSTRTNNLTSRRIPSDPARSATERGTGIGSDWRKPVRVGHRSAERTLPRRLRQHQRQLRLPGPSRGLDRRRRTRGLARHRVEQLRRLGRLHARIVDRASWGPEPLTDDATASLSPSQRPRPRPPRDGEADAPNGASASQPSSRPPPRPTPPWG